MTNTTKFYSNKQNAKRAAIAAKLDLNKCELTEVDGMFAYVPMQQASDIKQGLPFVRNSTIVRPCKQVWHIADGMPGSSRKQVMEACINSGIAFYTARTQYQLWAQCQKEMAARVASTN